MNGPATAALALSAALLIPMSPRHRLGHLGRPAQSVHRGTRRVDRNVAAGCVAGCLTMLAVVALPLPAGLAVAALAATAGLRYRQRIRRRRGIDEARALEAALDVLVGELRIGAHPLSAFEAAAAETEHPAVAAALGGVAARARLGADVAAGLRSAAESSLLPGRWQQLAVYWQLGCDCGLAIATLMQAAQRDIAERQRFSAQADSDLAGARASAAILAGLPLLGVLLGQLIGAEPLAFLFGERGSVLLLVGVVLVCVGLLWSDRITRRLT